MWGLQDVLQAASMERLRVLQALLVHGADVHAAKSMPPPDWRGGSDIRLPPALYAVRAKVPSINADLLYRYKLH